MKHLSYNAIVFFLLLGVNQAIAQDRNLGVGLIIGEPTGISLKLWTGSNSAIDFGLGWSLSQNINETQNSRIHLHMDVLRHSFNVISSAEQIPVYYGLGARFVGGSETDNSLAVRSVFGLAWEPHYTPLDLFLEVAPSLQVVPSTTFALDAAVGIRYYF